MKTIQNPNDLIAFLNSNNITEGYFIYRDGKLVPSHPELSDLAEEISQMDDFLNHEGIFFEVYNEYNSLFTAFVYNTVRGQAAGGVRFRSYESIDALFSDGLRLAKGMADKNAVARLWWGGGKGIIYRDNVFGLDEDTRYHIYKNYGLFMSKLNGVYITAEDMNTRPKDMGVIFSKTRHTTCIPITFGGSSNPSIYTAKGVFSGLKAGAEFKYGKENALKDKIVLLQGAGNVGYHVMEQAVDAGAKVFVYEPNSETHKKIRAQFNEEQVSLVDSNEKLISMKGHIFSPNAIGAILNDESIANLQVDVIAGGANNQLLDSDKHSAMLQEKGIWYLPDFFINRLGIINCANEQYGYVKSDIDKEVELVYTDSLDLLQKAADQNVSPQKIAADIATERMKQAHPIWGHRGPKLVDEIIRNGFGKTDQVLENGINA